MFRRALAMAFSALLITPFAAAATEEYKSFQIPPKFWGEYNSDLKYCETALSDMRLRISGNKIQFYESTGILKGQILQKNGDIIIFAEFKGEGQIWSDILQLSLSSDQKMLTVTHPSTSEIKQFSSIRNRCS